MIALAALLIGFAVAAIASRFDPGPDWFDTHDNPHVDAALLGGLASVVAAGLTAALLRWLSRRPSR